MFLKYYKIRCVCPAKYNPRLYLIRNLKFPASEFELNQDGIIELDFSNLTTSFNERLPVFKNPPMINIQGHSISITILNVTKKKVTLVWEGDRITYSEKDKDKKFYLFDMWITSTDK